MTMPPAIELRDGAVRVGDRDVWRGVDVVVPEGAFVAVMGANGVGKSTLLKAILGLVPLSAGQLRVLGRPAGEANDQIGYLPQRRSFDARLRIRGVDVVRLGLDGHRWGFAAVHRPARAARDRIVDDIVDVVGASHYADRPIGELSGGEQQRLLIAQALVQEPRLLLLDEPLDSLDLPNQAAVTALVADVCDRRGVTVLLVTHDVNPVLAYVDGVIYLGRGGAVSGPPADVVTSETLSRLYGTPIEVLRARDGRLVVVGQPDPPAHHSDRHGT